MFLSFLFFFRSKTYFDIFLETKEGINIYILYSCPNYNSLRIFFLSWAFLQQVFIKRFLCCFSFKAATVFYLLLFYSTNHATKFLTVLQFVKCYTVYKKYYFIEKYFADFFFFKKYFLKKSKMNKIKKSRLTTVCHRKN